jgi:3-phytase
VILLAAGLLPGTCSDGSTGSSPAAAAALVAPTVETDPVPHRGDAADDPAIWVDTSDPARSVVIGTDKKGGLAVYDLTGRQLQYRPEGRMNNVDLRTGFPLDGESVTLVTAGNRSDNSISVYRLEPSTRRLIPVAARTITVGISTYGSCMYRSARTGSFYYFVDSQDGEVEQWELRDDGGGKVEAKNVRSFDVGSQTEGCVADDERGDLYVGEESAGIWAYGAEPEAGEERRLVDSTGPDGHLQADVEGLTLAYGQGRSGYLLASSQGDNSFAVYRRQGGNAYVGSFRIGAGEGVDGVEDTDGIDVATAGLGPAFPKGLAVVQDGKNDDGNQNYKLIDWREILRSLPVTQGPAG